MDTLSETKLAARVEREEAESQLAAANARIAELEKKNTTLKKQVDLASDGSGVPAHLVKDYDRRRRGGLNHKQAVDKAWQQWEEDKAREDLRQNTEASSREQVLKDGTPSRANDSRAVAAHDTGRDTAASENHPGQAGKAGTISVPVDLAGKGKNK